MEFLLWVLVAIWIWLWLDDQTQQEQRARRAAYVDAVNMGPHIPDLIWYQRNHPAQYRQLRREHFGRLRDLRRRHHGKPDGARWSA